MGSKLTEAQRRRMKSRIRSINGSLPNLYQFSHIIEQANQANSALRHWAKMERVWHGNARMRHIDFTCTRTEGMDLSIKNAAEDIRKLIRSLEQERDKLLRSL